MTGRFDALAAALRPALARHERLAIAVSGGVDSMVLAHVAQRQLGSAVRMVHAVSAAVPGSATARVQRHAAAHGWRLDLVDAGELADPDYRRNPVDRCYHCKHHLYATMHRLADGAVASGTNRDDLDDYRPGLLAAQRHGVVHPYVEAGLGKRDIYALAAAAGLDDLAALPAQPCLASRVETGIEVDATTLAFIERIEQALAARLPQAEALRCRVTAAGVVVECAPWPDAACRAALEAEVRAGCEAAGRTFAGLRPYRRGSAFLRVQGT